MEFLCFFLFVYSKENVLTLYLNLSFFNRYNLKEILNLLIISVFKKIPLYFIQRIHNEFKYFKRDNN